MEASEVLLMTVTRDRSTDYFTLRSYEVPRESNLLATDISPEEQLREWRLIKTEDAKAKTGELPSMGFFSDDGSWFLDTLSVEIPESTYVRLAVAAQVQDIDRLRSRGETMRAEVGFFLDTNDGRWPLYSSSNVDFEFEQDSEFKGRSMFWGNRDFIAWGSAIAAGFGVLGCLVSACFF